VRLRGDRAASFDATQAPQGRVDDERLFAGIVELAMQYGCYGYCPAPLIRGQA